MRHIIRYASDIRRVRVISCFTPLIDRRLGELGRLVRVEITFVDKLHIIRIIRYLTNQLGRSLVRKLARIGHIDFSIRTTFRRNQDYPISPSVTVNGTRSGIFQDRHTLNIVGIQCLEIPFAGYYSIDNIGGCATATDRNLWSTAWFSTLILYNDTGSTSLQGSSEVGIR